jgi:hypothetical protein
MNSIKRIFFVLFPYPSSFENVIISDIILNWDDMRTKFGYNLLYAIVSKKVKK